MLKSHEIYVSEYLYYKYILNIDVRYVMLYYVMYA